MGVVELIGRDPVVLRDRVVVEVRKELRSAETRFSAWVSR